jgi:hypothetical protein
MQLRERMTESEVPRWLLLIHQIPPKPGYLRVKIWRQLQRLGAVAVKNTVYVLPRSDQSYEDLQWVLRAIVDGGGDAMICEARFAEGLDDPQVEALFHAARDADYAQIAEDAKRLSEEWPSTAVDIEQKARLAAEVSRLRRRFSEVAAIDFFGAPGRDSIHGLLCALEARANAEDPAIHALQSSREEVRGRTWVTRKGIHVDRMASGWLIRRFIDPDARFKFVDGKRYQPEPAELRFDMFEAEFTHEGDRCTFEVLLDRFDLDDPSLRPLAEIVHDIDLKDSKFGRPETQGVASLVAGIAMGHRDDETRLARGSAVFEDLREYFRRKEPGSRRDDPTRARKDRP